MNNDLFAAGYLLWSMQQRRNNAYAEASIRLQERNNQLLAEQLYREEERLQREEEQRDQERTQQTLDQIQEFVSRTQPSWNPPYTMESQLMWDYSDWENWSSEDHKRWHRAIKAWKLSNTHTMSPAERKAFLSGLSDEDKAEVRYYNSTTNRKE